MDTALPERVRRAIAASSATHRDFARSVGLDPTKLSKSLNGVRRFTTDELTVIADAGRVPLQWIVDGTGAGPVANGRAPAVQNSSGMAGGPRDEDRRTRFLEAATRLIAQNGYHSVRIADIAAACGTSSGTVHYHFPGKDDIMTSALAYCFEQAFTRQSAELHDEPNARAKLVKLVELQLPKPGTVRREWSVWLQFWTEAALRPEIRPTHNHFYLRWSDTVKQIVRHGQLRGCFRPVDAEAFALRFTALTDGLAVQVLTGVPGVTIDMMRSELLGLIERELIATP